MSADPPAFRDLLCRFIAHEVAEELSSPPSDDAIATIDFGWWEVHTASAPLYFNDVEFWHDVGPLPFFPECVLERYGIDPCDPPIADALHDRYIWPDRGSDPSDRFGAGGVTYFCAEPRQLSWLAEHDAVAEAAEWLERTGCWLPVTIDDLLRSVEAGRIVYDLAAADDATRAWIAGRGPHPAAAKFRARHAPGWRPYAPRLPNIADADLPPDHPRFLPEPELRDRLIAALAEALNEEPATIAAAGEITQFARSVAGTGAAVFARLRRDFALPAWEARDPLHFARPAAARPGWDRAQFWRRMRRRLFWSRLPAPGSPAYAAERAAELTSPWPITLDHLVRSVRAGRWIYDYGDGGEGA